MNELTYPTYTRLVDAFDRAIIKAKVHFNNPNYETDVFYRYIKEWEDGDNNPPIRLEDTAQFLVNHSEPERAIILTGINKKK